MSRKIMLYIIIVVLLLCGCQPTPENAVVVNKNEGVLEERIIEEYGEENIFDVPEYIESEIYRKEGLYEVLIDAKTEVVKLPEYQVFSIVPDYFSQDEVDRIIDYFFDGSQLFAEEYILTKDMILDQMVQIKAEMKSMEKNSDDFAGAQVAIEKFEEQYETAPETIERSPISSRLTYSSDMGCDFLWAFCDAGFDELSTISITNKEGSQNLFITIDRSRLLLPNIPLDNENAENNTMAKKEAEIQVTQILQELGIKNMVPIKTEVGVTEDRQKQGFKITFRKSVNGIPVALFRLVSYSEERVDMAAKWPSDEITVMIDDEGVSAFLWSDKGKIRETLTTNVKMLSFNEIYDIAKQQLKNKFAWIETNKDHINYFQTIYVDRIALEYVCTKEKNNEGSYLLIPAWNFYGDIDLTFDNGVVQPQHGVKSTDTCLLSLNAVDGSVIGENGE